MCGIVGIWNLDSQPVDLDALQRATTIGTYHLPLTTYFCKRGGFKAGDFPVTDDASARAISLPLFEELTLAQQEMIVSKLEEALTPKGEMAT